MAGKCIKVGFVGCGAVNFGREGVSWDHASRLEKHEGLKFVGIADLDLKKAEEVLNGRKNGKYGHLYNSCKVFKFTKDLLEECKPDVVLLGIPPFARGSFTNGKSLELEVIKSGAHLLVEKPMSTDPPEEYEKYASAVEQAQKEKGVVVSVGYMFRYHAAFRKMKELIDAHGGKVMSVNMRCYCNYENVADFWWDVSKSGGPVVEQATHYLDITRYLAGEVDYSSISTICVRIHHQAGKLSKVPTGCEDNLTSENTMPRATMSTWRFEDGGVGSLTHTVALHGDTYESSIDVQLDGLRLILEEPYEPTCKLRVRDGSKGDKDVVYDFGDADPYQVELDTFIDAVKSTDASKILSTFPDAAKTYLLSWAIRRAERDMD